VKDITLERETAEREKKEARRAAEGDGRQA
jgi:hypothetical protein